MPCTDECNELLDHETQARSRNVHGGVETCQSGTVSKYPHRTTRLHQWPTLCEAVGWLFVVYPTHGSEMFRRTMTASSFSQGRRGEDRRMGSSSSRGEGCLHVRRRWAHTRTHQRHVCPPQASSRVGFPCTQVVRAPLLPSPIDNEISSPCVSSCPSSKDSPPSHTEKPSTARLCSRRFCAEEEKEKKRPTRPIWRRSTGTSDCRCENVMQYTKTYTYTLGRDRDGAASHVHIRIEGSGCNRRESASARGDAHSEAISKDVSERMPDRGYATRGGAGPALDRRSCCLVVAAVVVERFGAGKRRAPAGRGASVVGRRVATCDSRSGSSIPRLWARGHPLVSGRA